MFMLIKTQKKDQIINFGNYNRIYKQNVGCGYAIYAEDSKANQVTELGIYAKDNTAMYVLERICNFANQMHIEQIVPDQFSSLDGVVFEMPEDDEQDSKNRNAFI